MEEIKQMLTLYPHLNKMANRILFVTEEEIGFLKSGEIISVSNKDYSVNLLTKILEDENYYNYVQRYFSNQIDTLTIAFAKYGDLFQTICLDKLLLMTAFEVYANNHNVSKDDLLKLDGLKKYISYDQFLISHNDETFSIDVDGNHYNIQSDDLIKVMELSEDDFKTLCNSEEIKYVKGVPKDHFVYAAVKYFENNSFAQKYLLHERVLERLSEFPVYFNMDLQSLNSYLTTKDTMHEKVSLDNRLESLIKEGMPQELTPLEKAIYLYIKMCKIFTYDEEFYAVNQTGPVAEKHKDISYVSNITPENNKVVCFEFNVIYSKLLHELGIKFESDYKGMATESYGTGSHANLEFRYGKFIVGADSVTSIIQGDLFQAKINQPLVGLVCKNDSPKTRKEFKEYVSKVYAILSKNEVKISHNALERKESFHDILKQYAITTSNALTIPLEEKFAILTQKINDSNMTGIDNLSYILQLRKTIFTDEERKNNIKIIIVRNNETYNSERTATASAIIAISHDGLFKENSSITYYCYTPGMPYVELSKEQIETRFNEGLLEYVTLEDPAIPGINVMGVKKS